MDVVTHHWTPVSSGVLVQSTCPVQIVLSSNTSLDVCHNPLGYLGYFDIAGIEIGVNTVELNFTPDNFCTFNILKNT